MISIKIIIFLGTSFATLSAVSAIEHKALKFLINLFSGELMETKSKSREDDETTPYQISKGSTNNSFIDFITYKDKKYCFPYENVEYLKNNQISEGKKSIIKVRCLPERGNGTMHIINSLKEVVALLAPHGNSTKRTDEGNCVLVLFYTKTCPLCAVAAPHFNLVPKQFPDLRIGAIDAIRFHSLNTDFGIVGLPTIMLFHQGRPVIKFNDTATSIKNFMSFVTKHTGLEPVSNNIFGSSEDLRGPLSNKVEIETDYYLHLAWWFIIVCGCYYFTKSKLYPQIIEVIQRNWRESEAQHEHNQ